MSESEDMRHERSGGCEAERPIETDAAPEERLSLAQASVERRRDVWTERHRQRRPLAWEAAFLVDTRPVGGLRHACGCRTELPSKLHR